MSAALSLSGLSAAYARRTVLHDIHTEFASGQVTGIVGPNGAGKTTLFRAILGLLPAAGAIAVLGRARESWPRERLARAIAYLPQASDAHWPITAERLVALGRLPHRPAFAPLDAADHEAIAAALARCEAGEFAPRRIDTLSGGERARVLLARALATGAAILLADEPAAHLDPAHQLRLMTLLREEAARGCAVAVTLHDLSLATRFCDAIVVMRDGRIAAQGAPADALRAAVLAEVFQVRRAEGESFALERL